MTDTHTFNPSQHLVNLKGKDYLEVKWRLVWLRDVYPDAEISTELVEHHPGQGAVVRAFVKTPAGGIATGYGSETKGDFNDYLEKAETKAIGRALAALGFGTQFCDDFVFGAEAGRVVDSPTDFNSTRGLRADHPDAQRANGHAPQNFPPRGRTEGHNTMPANGNYPPQQQGGHGGDQLATPRQVKFIEAIAREQGIGDDMLDEEILNIYNCTLPELTRRDASAFIERLQSRRGNTELAS